MKKTLRQIMGIGFCIPYILLIRYLSCFTLGMPELAPYICEGDWAKARSNSHKWGFERMHQIGTGDAFCDHTYKRISKDF